MTNKIGKFISGELQNWKFQEILFLIIVYVIVAYNAIFLHDSLPAIIAAVCGATATMTAGKGKISTYIFGIFSTLCYAYISYKSMIWGNCLLNLCYYFPLQFIGIAEWKKHMKPDKQEIVKTKLTKNGIIITSLLLIISCICTSLILKYFNDLHPFMDAITTVGSIFGAILTVKRCFEQWYVWFIVNGLTLYMWIEILMSGEKVYSTVIQWLAYFIIGTYFIFVWHKELKI